MSSWKMTDPDHPGFIALSRAYVSGRRAYDNGMALTACPHRSGELRQLWLAGFEHAANASAPATDAGGGPRRIIS